MPRCPHIGSNRYQPDVLAGRRSSVPPLEATVPRRLCISDDHLAGKSCEQAVNDQRAKHGVATEIVDLDGTGVRWRK